MTSADFNLRVYISSDKSPQPSATLKTKSASAGKVYARLEGQSQADKVFDYVIGKAKVAESPEEMQELMASKKWIPLSLKNLQSVKDAKGLTPQEIVFVRVDDLAKLRFVSEKQMQRIMGSKEDFSLKALQIRAALGISFQIHAEDSITKSSAVQKWSEPVRKETVGHAQALFEEISGVAYSKEQRQLLLESRTEGSTTIQGDASKKKAWEAADDFVKQKAEKHKNLTLEDLCKINALISGEDAKELQAGQWRTSTIALGGFGGLTYAGSDQQDVEELMYDFSTWLDGELQKCEKQEANPIIVAALAYQRMVSIHPFPDGNGRTARLVMDYVLMRFGLPPASLGGDVKVAIFGEQKQEDLSEVNSTPSKAVEKIIEGIKNSLSIMNPKT